MEVLQQHAKSNNTFNVICMQLNQLLQVVSVCALFSLSHAVSAADPIFDKTFDHIATSFPLDGQHKPLDCESCHTDAVFDELPIVCSECHNGVFAIGKPTTHIPTQVPCGICHNVYGFSISTLALFDHATIGMQSCASCHNGISATGKPDNHIPSSQNCAACHNVTNWIPANAFDHN